MNIWILAGLLLILAVVGYVALKKFESMAGKTNDELRAYLQPDASYLFYNNALKELRKRDQDIRRESLVVLELLTSESKNKRIAGWLTLKENYPELAARVPHYDPQETVSVCCEKVQRVIVQS